MKDRMVRLCSRWVRKVLPICAALMLVAMVAGTAMATDPPPLIPDLDIEVGDYVTAAAAKMAVVAAVIAGVYFFFLVFWKALSRSRRAL